MDIWVNFSDLSARLLEMMVTTKVFFLRIHGHGLISGFSEPLHVRSEETPSGDVNS